MTRFVGSVLALAAVLAAGTAGAADLPGGSYYTAPGPISSYSWTGPYLGGNLGYGWGSIDRNPTKPGHCVCNRGLCRLLSRCAL